MRNARLLQRLSVARKALLIPLLIAGSGLSAVSATGVLATSGPPAGTITTTTATDSHPLYGSGTLVTPQVHVMPADTETAFKEPAVSTSKTSRTSKAPITQAAPTSTTSTTSTTVPPPQVPSSPLVGVDVVPTNDFATDRADGVEAVMVQAAWSNAETANGTFNTAYGASLASQVAQARAAGLKVVIDPGIQYPPSWAFLLNSSARFVDQYGDQLSATLDSGEDAVNAVTDPQVRTALAGYLAWLGKQFPAGSLSAVREGGGPTGELRYPSGDYATHTDAWWAYDPDSQAASKVPGWKPGTGTAAQAQTFVTQYDNNLDAYGVWLDAALTSDFGAGMQKYLMLPSWGDRPGELTTAEQNLLLNVRDEAHMGLDWTSLFPLIPDPQHTTLYSTWADAPSYGNTPTGEDPIDFIASLNSTGRFTLGGENTGGDDLAQMNLMVSRVKALHFVAAFWFAGTTFADDTSTDPTLQQWTSQS